MLSYDLLQKRGPGIVMDVGIAYGISSEWIDCVGRNKIDQFFILSNIPKDMGRARLWAVRNEAVGIIGSSETRINGCVVKMNNGWELFVPRVVSS